MNHITNRTVPAERGGDTGIQNLSKDSSFRNEPIRRGQFISARLLFRHWDAIHGALAGTLAGHKRNVGPRRADMVINAMRIQAFGECFASAAFLASHARASEKTWDRTLGYLKVARLVSVKRLHRENGEQSTNLTDFSRLFLAIVKALRLGAKRFRRGEARVTGVWVSVVALSAWQTEPPPILR